MENDLLDLLNEANLDGLDDISADNLPDLSWLLREEELEDDLTSSFTPSSTSDSSLQEDESIETDMCSVEPEENATANLEPRRGEGLGLGCASKNLCFQYRRNERERERRAELKDAQLTLQGVLTWENNERPSLIRVLQKAREEIKKLEEEKERLLCTMSDARRRFGRARATVYGYKLDWEYQEELAEAKRKKRLKKKEVDTKSSDGKKVKSKKKKRSHTKKYDKGSG